jgi:acetyl esterase/lipase
VSAGGNISAVLSHLARDHSLNPPLTGVCLDVPPIVHHKAVPEEYKKHYKSYHQLTDAPIIPRQTMETISKAHNATPSDPLFSIL